MHYGPEVRIERTVRLCECSPLVRCSRRFCTVSEQLKVSLFLAADA